MSRAALVATRPTLRLLGHDLRLARREFRAAFRALDDPMLVLLGLVLVSLLHAAAWPLARGFHPPGAAEQAYATVAPGLTFLMLLMIAHALNGVTKLLYGRRDFDLLFSSPLEPRTILMVRALGIAGGALASAAIFVVPLADAAVLRGDWRCLAFFPALLGGALLAATLGLVLALGVFALVGPRLMRLGAQILATFIGAGFMISLQLHDLLPDLWLFGSSLGDSPARHPLAVLSLLPVRAALGEPGPALLWLGGSAALFFVAVRSLAGRFARDAARAGTAGPDSAGRRRRDRAIAARTPERLDGALFAGGMRHQLRHKEIRLILRDPWIVSQILLQILYMSPMMFLLWSGKGGLALALGPLVVVVSFQVASSLTWLGLSGEDAAELLATAPVAPALFRIGKIEAVGLLTLAVVALPLLWLAMEKPPAALATLALAALGLGAAVLLQLWHGQPAKRSAFAARHRASKLVALIEMGLSMLFGVATALVLAGSLWSLVPLGLVGLVLLVARPRRERGQGARPVGVGN